MSLSQQGPGWVFGGGGEQGGVGAEQCQVPGLEELRGTRSIIALLEHSQKQILSSPSFKVIDCWRVMKNLMKSHLRKL